MFNKLVLSMIFLYQCIEVHTSAYEIACNHCLVLIRKLKDVCETEESQNC